MDGNLYVAEVNRILRYDNIEERLNDPPDPVVVYDQLPKDRHHGRKYIRFGPDGKLYVSVGAPCNICKSKKEIYATILRMNKDGSNIEIYAHGVRNSVGFDWHPVTKELWFTDNGRDWLGDNKPADELNRCTKKGQHFGYPYCHEGEISDPKFGYLKDCEEFVPPSQKLLPHVAALGMIFYTGDMFPSEYRNRILIAEHGSWNRTVPIGYRVSMVTVQNDKCTKYSSFAEGWLQDRKKTGRPVDILQLPDGSILVSDDFADRIYRISYSKS